MKRWLLLVGACVALVLFGVFFAREAPKSLDGTALPDFPNYYFGGERLFDGRPVYGSLEAEVEQRFGVSGYDAYPADPPPTVLLVAPLSLLPYDTAWFLLAGLSVIIMVSVTYLTAREVAFSTEASIALSFLMLTETPFCWTTTSSAASFLSLDFSDSSFFLLPVGLPDWPYFHCACFGGLQ